MAKPADVIVVGAGIVGCACAAACAAAGLAVTVVEHDIVGGGATAAGMGHIVVMDDSPAQLVLTHYSQTLWDALGQTAPAVHEYTRCGTLWVAADAEEMVAVHEKQALYTAHGVPAAVLDAPALYAHEPQLRPGLAGGLRVPGDSVVYPPRSAAWLLAQAHRAGATLRRARVAGLVPGGVVLAGGGVLRAEAVVVAAGMAARDLLPDLPLRPKKGHLVITDRYPGFVRHQLVELGYIKNAHASEGDSVAFNVQPRATGQLLIGSSRQFDTATRDVDLAILGRMLARARAYIPGLGAVAAIRVWTGVRAATPDGLPLIGPHPTRPGVWLATGHEGLGITTAPGTAAILAAQLRGQAPPIPAAPYLPARRAVEVVHA